MKLISILLIVVCFETVVTAAEIHDRYSLEDLDSAATLLRVVIDEAKDPKSQNKSLCGLTAREAKTLTEPLHALIDESVKENAKLYATKKRFHEKAYGRWSHCEEVCHCGAANDVLNLKESPSHDDENLKKDTRVKAESQTAEQSKHCALQATWFCSSSLLTHLRKNRAR